jgi:hypothetical protein
MQEEINKADITTSEIRIPAQLKGLFCEPPLLEGEDPEFYWGLLAAVIDERRPETAADWIAVNDLVTKLWEEWVFRRASNALIRGGTLEALEYFLEEVRKGENLKKTSDTGAHRACRYFSDNPKERNEIRSLLAQYGITSAELHAKAAQQNSDALQMFERMIASRERGRRKLRKEDDRRRRRDERRDEMRGSGKD